MHITDVILLISLGFLGAATANDLEADDPFLPWRIFADQQNANGIPPAVNDVLRVVSKGTKDAMNFPEYHKMRSYRAEIRNNCGVEMVQKAFRELFHEHIVDTEIVSLRNFKRSPWEKPTAYLFGGGGISRVAKCLDSMASYCDVLNLHAQNERLFTWKLNEQFDRVIFSTPNMESFVRKCPVELSNQEESIDFLAEPTFKKVTQNVASVVLKITSEWVGMSPHFSNVRKVAIKSHIPYTSRMVDLFSSRLNLENIADLTIKFGKSGNHHLDSLLQSGGIISRAKNLERLLISTDGPLQLAPVFDAIKPGLKSLTIYGSVVDDASQAALDRALETNEETLTTLSLCCLAMKFSDLKIPSKIVHLNIFMQIQYTSKAFLEQIIGLKHLKSLTTNLPPTLSWFYEGLPKTVKSLNLVRVQKEESLINLLKVGNQLESVRFYFTNFNNSRESLEPLFQKPNLTTVGFWHCKFQNEGFGIHRNSTVENLEFYYSKFYYPLTLSSELNSTLQSLPRLKALMFHYDLPREVDTLGSELMETFASVQSLKTLDFFVTHNSNTMIPELDSKPLAETLWRKRPAMTFIGY